MKKLFALALVAMMSLGASAQLITSNMVTKEKKAGYSRIGLSYNSISIPTGFDKMEDVDTENEAGTLNGVSLDILKGIKVSSALPLYIETGLGITYGWWSKSMEFYGVDVKARIDYLGLKVPVNVTYKYEVIDGLTIAPFIGLYLKGNIIASQKNEVNDESETINFFSKDDMGDYTSNRFNVGIDFGANIEYKKLYLGIGYAKDFNKFFGYPKAGGMGIFSATIGFVY